jgi:FAD/FMN-containing dehydrogenase
VRAPPNLLYCPYKFGQIKGRGHANNPFHSSTKGVQISLSLFKVLQVDDNERCVRLGAGWAWDDVFEHIEENFGIMLVGGRIPGVGMPSSFLTVGSRNTDHAPGVSGFVLGGGYSYKSNQYGLASDTTVAYELVTPTGDSVNVTAENQPELFFGLQVCH